MKAENPVDQHNDFADNYGRKVVTPGLEDPRNSENFGRWWHRCPSASTKSGTESQTRIIVADR
ncbi:hypothetical protein HMPREF3087_03265 [Brevibacterium sp. HMSC22B09]|nr:hypothetical protein HMPREF3092_00195 [Brevibacterium sp. HMSC24B04]OFT98251.1 hypothetical protein HMPREF3087_03265 [Brevibacterium sp. HMSC22B09]